MSDRAPNDHDPANATTAEPRTDVGPDPVWGVAVGGFGLVNMAVAGAITQHLWFNVGEGLMLLGAVLFLGSAAITHFKQRGVPTLAEVKKRLLASRRT